MRNYFILGATCLAAVGSFALAAEPSDVVAANVDTELLPALRPNLAREQYIAAVLRPLRQVDRDGDGLDRPDIERQKMQRDTIWRSSQAGKFLREDYDGDLVVTSAEIQRFGSGDADARKKRADRLLQKYDTDGNGSATLQEAMAQNRPDRPDRSDPLEGILAADQNADGRVTADELSALAGTTFDRFDSNHDRLISQEEYLPVSERRRALAVVRRLRDAGCVFPAPSAQAQIIGFGTHQGGAIASAYVGGPDEETSVVDVTIEQGIEPLYLLLTSHQPVIWRLDGDVGRVERVLASAYIGFGPKGRGSTTLTSAVGIMGLPDSKVSFTSRTCLSNIRSTQNGRGGRRREIVQSRIEAVMGYRPVTLLEGYSPARVTLPSGTIMGAREGANARPEGFDATEWQEVMRSWDGGLVQIDPAKVVAAAPVAPYRVLPSQMGLAQLVGAGAARKLEGNRYLILRDIARIPPRMTRVVLVLADGVKRPPGDPGHGCVVTEAEAAKTTGRNVCPPPPPIRTAPPISVSRSNRR